MLDAELHIALVVDRAGVGELVCLELHKGCGLARGVLQLPHDLVVLWTPLVVDQALLAPAEAVTHEALRHMHPIDVLRSTRLDPDLCEEDSQMRKSNTQD